MARDIERPLQWVWLVNGVVLLLFLLGGGVMVLGQMITNFAAEEEAVPAAPERERGEARVRAVRYGAPVQVRGSGTRLVVVQHGEGYEPSQSTRSGYGYSGEEGYRAGPDVNVAFLDAQGGRLLLDRPGYIAELRFSAPPARGAASPDSLLPWIVYEMALEDTNGDGGLDHRDRRALYVTDLEGRGLRPVLPPGMRLEEWSVLADGSLWVAALQEAAGGRRVDDAELPQRSFTLGRDGRLRAEAALDSLAAAAGRVLRR
jgi:hypothetical protein